MPPTRSKTQAASHVTPKSQSKPVLREQSHGSNRVLFVGGTIVLEDQCLDGASVECIDGKIVRIGKPTQQALRSCQVIDLRGKFLTPGFVDIHVHGGLNADFMDGTPEAIRMACWAHLRHGTTTIFPTTTTGSEEQIQRMLRATAVAKKQMGKKESRIAGVHLYGPYFAPEKSGCHSRTGCRNPVPDEVERYFASGLIKIATCAAELPGAIDFYRLARKKRCLITCGHSNSSWGEMAAAFDAGMRHVDHFWCAMSSVASVRSRLGTPMQGSMLEYVLSNPEMSTEVLADGSHLAPELLQFAWQMKGPKRLCLVTDCNRALDMPPGKYRFGDEHDGGWIVNDGFVGRAADGGLASSVQGMDTMVKNMAKNTAAPIHDVIRMASLTPAERTGIHKSVGSIEVGKRADLLILSNQLLVERVFMANQEVDLTQTPA